MSALAIYSPPVIPPFGKLNPQPLKLTVMFQSPCNGADSAYLEGQAVATCRECQGTGEIIVNSTYSLDPQEACSIPCECCDGQGKVEVCPTCQLEDCVCEEWLGVAA